MTRLKRDVFLLIMVFFILFSVVVLVTKVNAIDEGPEQTRDYLSMDFESDFGYSNDELKIYFQSNTQEIQLIILNPRDEEIHNKFLISNSSKVFKIKSNMDYGLYSIIGRTENQRMILKYQVINNKNFERVLFPYEREHKKIRYVFDKEEWEINLINDLNDKMTISLKEIKKLHLIYNFNVNAYVNEDQFLIRLSKNNVKIDIRYLFYFRGCKFIINGTLNSPRTFEIDTKSIKLKNMYGKFKAGKIVFDYQDIIKSGIQLNKYKDTIEIICDSSFYIDPIIFQDGFESGDTSAFDVVIDPLGGLSVTTGPPVKQTYKMQVEFPAGSFGNRGAVQKNIVKRNDTYAQVYFCYNDSASLNVNNFLDVLSFYTGLISDPGRINTGIQKHNATHFKGRVFTVNTTAQTGTVYFSRLDIENKFAYFQSHVDMYNLTNANITLWINDVLIYQNTTFKINNIHRGYTRVTFGGWTSKAFATPITTFYDDCVVSTYYIPELIRSYLTLKNFFWDVEYTSYWCTFSVDLETNSTPLRYWLSHNSTGAWVNETALPFPTNGTYLFSMGLPDIVNYPLGVRFFANSTNLYNSTLIRRIIIIASPCTRAWVEYNFTSIITLRGTNSSIGGNWLNQTYWLDDYEYNVTEVVGVPGYEILFNVSSLPDDLMCLELVGFMAYDGSAGHTFEVQAWNYTSSAWVTISDIPDTSSRWINGSIDCTSEHFIQNGLFQGSYYHVSPGNVNHEFRLDYGKLLAFAPIVCPTPSPVSGVTYLTYALAVILLLLGLMIGSRMRR